MPLVPPSDLDHTPPVDITQSVYWQLERRPGLTSYRLSKRTLIALSWAIEDQFCAPADAPLLFGAFQRVQFYKRAQQRWQHLAATSRHALVFADFDPGDAPSMPTQVRIGPDEPLADEWIVVCDSLDLPVVLAAWEVPGQGVVPEIDRLFQAVWTMDPESVRLSSRILAQIAANHGVGEAAPVLYELADNPPPAEIRPREASELFSRIVAYLDRFGTRND
ncbi:DICT sensory domain-containing protein [Microlunatus kandeliicorticis]|uniref:DICT sensory domain-containing protein n=1 Tax=Microlunatus kandeliicorticis TaxID=1759536 RepID=UPI0015F9229B|nr:DICT sensory domain-containing protein [Microlunatus kandeliicorticis]